MDWLNILTDTQIEAWASVHKTLIAAFLGLLKYYAVLKPEVPSNKITDLLRLYIKPKPNPIVDILGIPKRVSVLEKEVSTLSEQTDALAQAESKLEADYAALKTAFTTAIADLKAAIAANDPTVLNQAVQAVVDKMTALDSEVTADTAAVGT